MLTGSMSPLIKARDVVVTVPFAVEDVKVGDIITYRILTDDHRLQTHRVIDVVDNQDGTKALRTKGDANSGPDR